MRHNLGTGKVLSMRQKWNRQAGHTANVAGRLGRVLALAGFVGGGFGYGAVEAQQRKVPGEKVDLGDVFGFTVPTDTPGAGDREFAHETVGRFGEMDGAFRAFNTKTQIGYGVTDWFAVTPGLRADSDRLEASRDLTTRRVRQFQVWPLNSNSS